VTRRTVEAERRKFSRLKNQSNAIATEVILLLIERKRGGIEWNLEEDYV
jgi:hypothetical protein